MQVHEKRTLPYRTGLHLQCAACLRIRNIVFMLMPVVGASPCFLTPPPWNWFFVNPEIRRALCIFLVCILNTRKMDPTVWGPAYWTFLHTAASNYPKHPDAITTKIYYRLIHNFHEFIPHQRSAANFRKLLELYPVTPYLNKREKFEEWVNFIHNKVNAITGKPGMTLAEHRAAVDDLYLSKTRRWNRYVRNNFLVVSFVFIIVIVGLIYMFAVKSPFSSKLIAS